MPLYFVPPTTDTAPLLNTLETLTTRLHGILTTFRRDCLDTALAIYNAIPTKDPPVPTDLLHEFQNGDRESASDLQIDFPELELLDGSSEHCDIVYDNETVDIFNRRVKSGIGVAKYLGEHVVIVAPSSVILSWTGVTLNPGEVYEYSDECSYYERCAKELEEWRVTLS